MLDHVARNASHDRGGQRKGLALKANEFSMRFGRESASRRNDHQETTNDAFDIQSPGSKLRSQRENESSSSGDIGSSTLLPLQSQTTLSFSPVAPPRMPAYVESRIVFGLDPKLKIKSPSTPSHKGAHRMEQVEAADNGLAFPRDLILAHLPATPSKEDVSYERP